MREKGGLLLFTETALLLFKGRKISGKKGGELCKPILQKAIANHSRTLPCTIMVMLVNSTKVNNVKYPKSRVSFGRDHHVLQMIPDRYPATVCRNSIFNSRIATWNVRNMYQSGKMDNTIMEMKRIKITILGACEVRWKQSGKVTSEGTTFIYSEGIEQKHEVEYFLMRILQKVCLVSGVFQRGSWW